MKKVIYIIAMALCLSACCMEEVKHQESAVEKEYLYLNDQGTLNVIRFEYDDHKYILFSSGETRNGFVHDPDCPCHTVEAPSKTETSDYPDWW